MNRKPSSRDVARLAGVSQSAVSRAFTPGSSIKADTREKIRKAAKELGYQPNFMARSMKTQRSKIIGFVFGYMENQYYPLALEKLSRKLQALGYHSLMFFADSNEPADRIVEEFLQYQIDAVILASVSLSPDWIDACKTVAVPVILFNRAIDSDEVSAITSDNLAGGRIIADFLIAGGHRKIAYLSGFEGSSTNRDRETGFTEGLKAAGQTLFARAVGDYCQKRAREATLAMFDRPAAERPDALFVANDHMALAVLDTLRFELGLRAPEDVSVIGYDDVPLAAAPPYSLTTMRQPLDAMVDATVETLLEQLDQPSVGARRIEIDGPLMVRGSARIPEGYQHEKL